MMFWCRATFRRGFHWTSSRSHFSHVVDLVFESCIETDKQAYTPQGRGHRGLRAMNHKAVNIEPVCRQVYLLFVIAIDIIA